MRLFDQLEWKPHFKGEQAILKLKNGLYVSVLRGDGPLFLTEGGTYEIAAGTEYFDGDRWAFLTEEQAEQVLQSINAMPVDEDARNA